MRANRPIAAARLNRSAGDDQLTLIEPVNTPIQLEAVNAGKRPGSVKRLVSAGERY
jgi:hypothetical protein